MADDDDFPAEFGEAELSKARQEYKDERILEQTRKLRKLALDTIRQATRSEANYVSLKFFHEFPPTSQEQVMRQLAHRLPHRIVKWEDSNFRVYKPDHYTSDVHRLEFYCIVGDYGDAVRELHGMAKQKEMASDQGLF